MIRRVEGFTKYIAIAGFTDVNIRHVDGLLKDVRENLGHVHVQFFDARFVATDEHLYFAALNALQAFEHGLNRSRNLAVEVMLYASAQRQITNAVNLIGITPDSNRVAIVIISETEPEADAALEMLSNLIEGQRKDAVLALTDSKIATIRRLFGISDLELQASSAGRVSREQALVDLVVEHVALLATER